MPEIAKLEKKSFSGAMEKLEDSKLKKVLIWVFEIAVTLIFAVLTSMMLFQSVTMQESSMEPTLAVGSRYFVNKLASGDTSVDVMGLDVTYISEFGSAGWLADLTNVKNSKANPCYLPYCKGFCR